MGKNVTRIFDKQQLLDILGEDDENFEILENEMIDKSRWSIHYNLVFKELDSGKLYETSYSVGATESQDERPWEYETEIKCVEVEPVEVVTIKFKPVQI